ncbi:hypothetical protein PMI34_04366 [Pseudomonas sp. GM74]|uniref:hypothetical protein n=1 Tax=Pseudomonas sp. GM74 TaxID=1144336 RepID=UPI0002709C36|nr:hypothetical protein [Pseudomonas sp. GM74]EJM85115.1 hypothetical protein PMI34_04366 [Pseudomonas sp. GM74]
MSRIAFPFLTLSESAVVASPWLISLNESEWAPVEEYLQNWDAASSIRLRRRIAIDPSIAAADLNIDLRDLRFFATVRIGTGQGRLPRLILSRESRTLEAEPWFVEFDFEIGGETLSTVLDINTRITLASSISVPSRLSPSRLGDQLWSDRIRMRLEGEEPRFPIEIGDMQVLLGDLVASSAPWYLYWSPREWSRDFHGAIRLYLNSTHTEFIERIQDEDPMMIQMLMADVMGQVCERLITDPEVNDLFNSPEPGSLAAQASSWLKKAWPGKDTNFIKSVFDNRPGIFRASLVALADLGDK